MKLQYKKAKQFTSGIGYAYPCRFRDGFEDTMFEAKAKAKARQRRGQGQTTSRPCRGLSLTYSIKKIIGAK